MTERRLRALPAPRWNVYLVRCADGTLYAGVALDVARRLAEHRSGGARGAKYLRGRGPLELVLSCPTTSRSEALHLERAIKRLSKRAKESLVARPWTIEALIARIRARIRGGHRGAGASGAPLSRVRPSG
jgi:putative endonuclease